MAYKLSAEDKAKANFIRGLNKNIENAYKSFGKDSEIYQNLVSFANMNGLAASKSHMDFYQASASRDVLATMDIRDLTEQYYEDSGKIRKLYNTALEKENATRLLKKRQKEDKNTKWTLKTIYKTVKDNNLIAGLYKDTMENGVTPEQYEELIIIMENFRNGKISTEERNKLEKYANQKVIRQGNYFIDADTGEVLQDLSPDDEYIDPI